MRTTSCTRRVVAVCAPAASSVRDGASATTTPFRASADVELITAAAPTMMTEHAVRRKRRVAGISGPREALGGSRSRPYALLPAQTAAVATLPCYADATAKRR